MRKRQVVFWLDTDNEEEAELFDYLQSLKQKRAFHSTIRDGVRLVRSLRENRVDELEKQFHFVGDHYRKQVVPAPMEGLQEALGRVEQLFMIHTAPRGKLLPSEGSQRVLPASNELANDLEIKQATLSVDDKPSWNNHISMAKLLGSFDHLSPEMIEYGLRKGMIPSSSLKRAKANKAVMLSAGALGTKSEDSSNAKAMDVPQFDMPSFDDTELVALDVKM